MQARLPYEHFYELLNKNDEYVKFLALFPQVVYNAEALIQITSWVRPQLAERVRYSYDALLLILQRTVLRHRPMRCFDL